jgi:alpha-tubulin N-acetyltransferase 1
MDHPGARKLVADNEGIATLVSGQCKQLHETVIALVNQLGLASSRAQGLPHTITTYNSFMNSDMKMYILTADGGEKVLGFVKVGVRNLFLWDRKGAQHEKSVMCLLDFFTFPICQRKGYGKRMIDAMLRDCRLQMRQVPIDRPSSLCLSFMKKHFGLSTYLPQANNFVVFDDFWGDETNDVNAIAKQLGRHTTFPGKAAALKRGVVTNPAKKTHFNPVTWSLHPGVDQ